MRSIRNTGSFHTAAPACRTCGGLLADVPGWTGSELDAAIAREDRLEIKLPRRVPVAWIYLTGWKTNDGEVQFRDDIYDLDASDVASVRGKSRPANKPGSYLDAR